MLQLSAQAALAFAATRKIRAQAPVKRPSKHGAIIGEPVGAAHGEKVLADGGNAVDAIVTAALVSAVVSLHNCGIGGYGGHMTLALDGGKQVVSIDFNTTAPATMKADTFIDASRDARTDAHDHGWLAAGVPGTLAGLQLALEKFGTLSFREAIGPALKLARDGFPVSALAAAIRGAARKLEKDPGSAKLYLPDGKPWTVGTTFRNPELAEMLQALAERNSVDSFYRGDIAQRIAEAYQKNDGLVTLADLAAYRARVVEPLKLSWGDFDIFTAPLTAGGLTVLEIVSVLRALDWEGLRDGNEKAHARVEAMRLAWRDRLQFLGDPEHVQVPVERLLSAQYARELAEKIRGALKAKKPLEFATESRPHGGTVHLSCVDANGRMAALTLTHGNSFGACVTVPRLGLTLGHGMSRFDAKPGHPNSPGPGKRPLHNMCPTIVLRAGQPVLALGGAGGRRIPNSVFDVLFAFLTGRSLEEAIEAPRLQTDGNLEVILESRWPTTEVQYLESTGFKTRSGSGARVSGVAIDPATGEFRAASRI
jgi:gamma-glutamyltranspeptidase/glutathione hydrolase